MKAKLALVLLGSLLTFASPAAADWLVTRDGGRVETKGAWQIKGKLVVFTQTDGSLSSLRLSDVDLEASRRFTEDAKAEAVTEPAPPPPKKKIAVLTDKDFPKKEGVSSPEPAAEDAKEPKEDKDEKPAGPAATVTVASWKRVDRPASDGIEIHGTLQNNTDQIAAGVAVEVQLFNEAGERTATAPGIPSTPSIQPRGMVEFRATFLGVFSFARAKFETRGYPLDLSPAPDQPTGEAPPQ